MCSAVESVISQGRNVCDSDDDLWEYLIFPSPSRHYTYTNVLNKRMCGEVRTPGFETDLFDFYLSLPKELRLQANLSRGAMRRYSLAVAMIAAGNHGLPAVFSPLAKNLFLIGRKLLRHATGIKRFRPPEADDRT